VTAREENELRALVVQAFDHRESAYFVDACAAIVEWFERRPLLRLERQQEAAARVERILGLLRGTA
jgi:hypothetical protein